MKPKVSLLIIYSWFYKWLWTRIGCCNDTVHYIYNSSTLLHSLSPMNSVYILPFYFFQINFNIIVPSSLIRSELSTNILYPLFKPVKHSIWLIHLILVCLTTPVIFCEDYKLQSSSMCNFPPFLLLCPSLYVQIFSSAFWSKNIQSYTKQQVKLQFHTIFTFLGRISR
jgi:hypothetical protein